MEDNSLYALKSFNTQPPEGGWKSMLKHLFLIKLFQHTAARRRLDDYDGLTILHKLVSTHSRPKAAGFVNSPSSLNLFGFNTQPPEGGWTYSKLKFHFVHSFNTQPPEGGWQHYQINHYLN